MTADRVVIVGGGLGALRCIEALRRAGHDGDITAVSAEAHRTYDRPPLSKEVLRGEWPLDRVALRGDSLDDEAADAELEVDWRRGVTATSFEPAAPGGSGGTVVLDDGSSVSGEAVVLATGADARPLPGVDPDLGGVHLLRTLHDALALRADIEASAGPVVVVGGGFIGAEVAASARTMGREVTILEALPVPLSRVLGTSMGGALAALHADHGVEVRTSVRVEGIVGDAGSVDGVEVTEADGSRSTVAASVVVVGIGAVPATAWLEGSGLTIGDGVVCDASLAAAPGVWAIGDVARWPNERYGGESMRLEHWTNAVESGLHVAREICAEPGADPTPFTPLPYVWSDQYEHKILHIGRNRADDEVEVLVGSVEERRWVAGYQRDGVLVAALALDDPRRFMRFRRLVDAAAPWSDAVALAADLSG